MTNSQPITLKAHGELEFTELGPGGPKTTSNLPLFRFLVNLWVQKPGNMPECLE